MDVNQEKTGAKTWAFFELQTNRVRFKPYVPILIEKDGNLIIEQRFHDVFKNAKNPLDGEMGVFRMLEEFEEKIIEWEKKGDSK